MIDFNAGCREGFTDGTNEESNEGSVEGSTVGADVIRAVILKGALVGVFEFTTEGLIEKEYVGCIVVSCLGVLERKGTFEGVVE